MIHRLKAYFVTLTLKYIGLSITLQAIMQWLAQLYEWDTAEREAQY